MLPVSCVLAAALVITAVIDLANGNVPFLGEAQHLPEVISVGLVWALATPSRRRNDPTRARRAPHLHAVPESRREAG